jgi:uncharacterized protein YndB with AHSA1/START domain
MRGGKLAMAKGASMTIRRRIKAPPEIVWKACTTSDLMLRWMSPRAFATFEVEADLRVDGRFAFKMTGDDGVMGAEGEYREIVENRRLVMTWRWNEGPPGEVPYGVETLLTFELAPDGDGTLLTLTHAQLPDDDTASEHENGWTEALEKLRRFVEQDDARGRLSNGG